MKTKNLLFIPLTAIALSSCNMREAEMQALNRRSDSLQNIIDTRDSSINDFLTSYNEIERNLSEIARKQDVITKKVEGEQGELKTTVRERINEEIVAINTLLEENRKRIDELNKKLKSSNARVGEFQGMISNLNEKIAEKDKELVDLNNKLSSLNQQVAQLNTSVDTLTAMTNTQAKTIEDQTTSMHTAYYIVDKSKKLEEQKVIDRTGGLLGIGKTSQLSSNFDNSRFTRIDYTQTTTIPINSADARIVTIHPSGSYKLNRTKDKVTDLVISDPEKFWSASKYLVVVQK